MVGRREGEAEGLRLAILALCEVLGIEVTADRRERLTQASLADLQPMLHKIKGLRSWPAS